MVAEAVVEAVVKVSTSMFSIILQQFHMIHDNKGRLVTHHCNISHLDPNAEHEAVQDLELICCRRPIYLKTTIPKPATLPRFPVLPRFNHDCFALEISVPNSLDYPLIFINRAPRLLSFSSLRAR